MRVYLIKHTQANLDQGKEKGWAKNQALLQGLDLSICAIIQQCILRISPLIIHYIANKKNYP